MNYSNLVISPIKITSLLVTIVLSLFITSCGDASPEVKLIACEVIDESYIKSKYPQAEKIKTNSRDVSMSSTCTYTFKLSKQSYYIKTQFHYGNNEDTLKTSIRSRGVDGIALSGIGKMAYQDIKIGQVNVWDGSHVFQVNVSDGKKYNVDIAIDIAKDILAKL